MLLHSEEEKSLLNKIVTRYFSRLKKVSKKMGVIRQPFCGQGIKTLFIHHWRCDQIS